MSIQEFVDILEELIVVDTEEGLVSGTYVKENEITVKFYDKTTLTLKIE